MRTLKKTLSLVLVLAMMVGLCAVGASAITVNDYKDKDSIPNLEAFATLTAIGVFQGDDQGNVNPTAVLNRAEGATLAAKMHATSGYGTSTFTDMGAYAWAQPAVAYCEASGIINGYGDGRFGPADPLSTVAFAKICLTSLGYDAQKEGLTGPQWEINTIKLVNALNLADGIGNPDWNANIPRWQAAQFCYNTLQATMVDYNGLINFSVTTSDGTKVEVGTGASAIENNSYDYMNRSYQDGGTMEFCENYFPLLKLDTHTVTDSFGFKSNAWFMGDTRVDRNRTPAKTIATVNASTILATYTTGIAGVTGKTLYTDGKGDANHTGLTVIVNGGELVGTNIKMDRLGAAPLLGAYKGSTAYLIDTDPMTDDGYGIADTLIIKQPTLAKVTKITEATASADRTATLTVYDSAKGTANVKFVTDSYAKNDFILVYENKATGATAGSLIPFASELATSAAGSLSKFTGTTGNITGLTIGGVAYSVAAKANLGPNGATVAGGTYVLGTGMTAYTSNGFVLGIVTDAVAYGNYVFSILAVTTGPSALGNTSYTVGSVDQTGKATEVLGANVNTSGAAGTVAPTAMTNTWATKAEAANGYTFQPAKTSMNVGFPINGLKSNQPNLATWAGNPIIADNSTVFVIRTATGFASYTGLSSVPNYYAEGDNIPSGKTALKTYAYALIPDTYAGAHAVAVYIDATAATPKNTTTATLYLVSNAPTGQEQGADGKPYNSYTAIIDGKITPVLGLTTATISQYGIVIPAYAGSYLAATEAATNVYCNHVSISENSDYVVNADNGLLTFYRKGQTHVAPETLPLDANAVAYVYTSARAPLETGAPADLLNGLFDENVKSAAERGTDVTISVELNQAGYVKTIYVNMADIVA